MPAREPALSPIVSGHGVQAQGTIHFREFGMGKEIERKFLVKSDAWRSLAQGTLYRQGYQNTDKERTVRVRTVGDKAFLTIKGLPVGVTRFPNPIGWETRSLATRAISTPTSTGTIWRWPLLCNWLFKRIDIFWGGGHNYKSVKLPPQAV